MRSATFLSAAIGVALVLGLVPRPVYGDETDDVRIELSSDGRATVIGTGSSVRGVLEKLCWDAGGVLHYDASDESFTIALEDQPLERVIARLLRRQSYVLRMGRTADGRPRLTELQVLGAGGMARRQLQADRPAQGKEAGDAPDFFVPLSMLEASFGDADAAHRETALRELVDGVRTDPERLRAFLAVDPAVLRPALLAYPQAANVLRSLTADPALDPQIRSKLDALIALLQ